MDFLKRTLCCCFTQNKNNEQHSEQSISNRKGNLNPAFRESPLSNRYNEHERPIDVYNDDQNQTVQSLKNAIMRLSTISRSINEMEEENHMSINSTIPRIKEESFYNQSIIEKVKETSRNLTDPLKFVPKILLLGSSGVGKNAIFWQYMYGEFKERSINVRKKLIRSITILNSDQDFEISPEQVNKIDDETEQLIKEHNGFIIVFDLTNRQSFDDVLEFRNAISRFKNEDSHYSLILVGNKLDLVETRVITYEEANSLAQSLEIPYFETSAKTADNLNEIFKKLMESLRNENFDKNTAEEEEEWNLSRKASIPEL